MSPKELVIRALRFERPERVPRQLWVLPYAQQRYPRELAEISRQFPDDIAGVPFVRPAVPGVRGNPFEPGDSIDEWGCEFTNICDGILGEVKRPMIVDYARDLDRLRPPIEWLHVAPQAISVVASGCEQFTLLGPGVNPFERMQFLRGTENLMVDVLEQPSGFAELLRKVHTFNLALIDHYAQAAVDGISFMDDWGSQQSLLIRPVLWRKLFKPLYRQYVEHIHAAGKFAFMHSDGYIFDILADLVEIGVDAINCQLFCMDIEELGRRFRGRITFWGEIDRQHILPAADIQQVRGAVQRVASALHDGAGGVIAQCEFGPGARAENVRAVFDEWEKVVPTGHAD